MWFIDIQNVFGVVCFMVIFFVLSASLDGVVRIWENETGNCSLSLVGHREPVYSVSYSPDGKFIATGSSDRCVNIWSTQVKYSVCNFVWFVLSLTSSFNSCNSLKIEVLKSFEMISHLRSRVVFADIYI